MSLPRPLSNRGGGYTAARLKGTAASLLARVVAAHFVCLETTARSVRKANKGKSAHSGQRAAHTSWFGEVAAGADCASTCDDSGVSWRSGSRHDLHGVIRDR